jgi:hypothetical protein
VEGRSNPAGAWVTIGRCSGTGGSGLADRPDRGDRTLR